MKLDRTVRLLLVASLVGAFAFACGGDEPAKPQASQAKKAAPPPTRADRAKLPEPSAKEQLAARAALPDYYPSDAPVYKGATTNSAGWQSGRVNAVFSTSDDPDTVSAAVQKSLRSSGWQEIVEAEMVNGVVVQADKDDRSISALISRMEAGDSDEVTMIMVAVDP